MAGGVVGGVAVSAGEPDGPVGGGEAAGLGEHAAARIAQRGLRAVTRRLVIGEILRIRSIWRKRTLCDDRAMDRSMRSRRERAGRG